MQKSGQYALDKLKPCPACSYESTDFERRDGAYAQGVAPELCIHCQKANPGARWCKRCEKFETSRSCPVRLHERDKKRVEAGEWLKNTTIYTCPPCGKSGRHVEMYGLKSAARRTCKECAEAHPGMMWCFSHKRFDPAGDFPGPGYRRCTPRTKYCPGCRRQLARPLFDGTGRAKIRGKLPPVCLECYAANPGLAWCSTHTRFEDKATADAWATGSCTLLTREWVEAGGFDRLLQMHDAVQGQCMCCRAMGKRLVTDHDHDCCPSHTRLCGTCVRGLICPDCNTIEGKVRRIYGPPFPGLIQAYLDRYERSRTAAA